MPNGGEMLDDMEFEERLDKAIKDGSLPEFNARQIWQMRKDLAECQAGLTSKKATTSISAITAGVVSAIISFFYTKFAGGG
jgi:hypothetical protein